MEESIGPGDLVGDKYRVECVLASSTQATLLAVWDEVLERPLAVKLLPTVREPRRIARFVREARSAAKLESEHVVRIVDVGTLATGMPFMVLERLDGFDLGELLDRDGSLPPNRIADYMLQACEGLAHAHAAGIVHRDVKPQNLFLASRADGVTVVKILDFGIAKAGGDQVSSVTLTSAYSLLGSPSYMSPEQIEAPKTVDARADIWSLGVVMYKLATGRAPFTGDTLPVLTRNVKWEKAAPFAKPGSSLAPLERIVMRCLNKSRDGRYPNVLALARDLAVLAPARSKELLARIEFVLGTGKSVDDDALAATTLAEDGDPDDLVEQTATTARIEKPAMASPGLIPPPVVLMPTPVLMPAPVPMRAPVRMRAPPPPPLSTPDVDGSGLRRHALGISLVIGVAATVAAMIALSMHGRAPVPPEPSIPASIPPAATSTVEPSADKPPEIALPGAASSATEIDPAPPPTGAAGFASAGPAGSPRAHTPRPPARPRASGAPAAGPPPPPASATVPGAKPQESLPKALGGRI